MLKFVGLGFNEDRKPGLSSDPYMFFTVTSRTTYECHKSDRYSIS